MSEQEVMERIKAIAERLRGTYHAQRVILFGSVIRGEASADSDTDLLIIAPTQEPFFARSATVLGLVRDLYPGLALSPIVLTPEEVRHRLDRGDPFVQEIVGIGVSV
jgi:predicted nucleotidyltransferase